MANDRERTAAARTAGAAGSRIEEDTLRFFEGRLQVLPVYEALAYQILRRYPQTVIRVQKTQISFSDRHLFACVSFLRPKRKAELPEHYFTLTLGLPYPLASDRVAARTEPWPGRWTTHIPVGTPEELDEELFGWVRQAHEFAVSK